MPTKTSSVLRVAVDFKGREPAVNARAYIFNRAGILVKSRPLDGPNLEFEVDTSQDYRVTLGPDLMAGLKTAPPNLAGLLAKERVITRDYIAASGQAKVDFTVHPQIAACWWKTSIQVHGSVRKLLNPGGGPPVYAPICTGTVQIFQVDLGGTLDQIAPNDWVLLKAGLVERLTLIPPINPPDPGPVSSGLQRLFRDGHQLQSSVRATAGAVATASRALPPVNLAASIQVLEGTQLKDLILAQKPLLWPLLCGLIPDSAFAWQELAETPIQSDGTFSQEISFWCPQDFPDLYFEVVQNLQGIETEISDPPIACSTYYDYDGSQDVLITVDDPRAIACNPNGPDLGFLYVWPTAIGNVELNQIDGLETGLGSGLLPGATPFAGTLCLKMIFDPNLQANGVRYYRWSYRFDGESDFTPIIAPVTHRYQTVSYSPLKITLHGYNLGPRLVGGTPGLFEIPDPNLDWVNIVDPVDAPFAYFDTAGRTGMATLLLEMFDAGGNLVTAANTRGASTAGDQPGDPGAVGPFDFILPQLGGPPDTYDMAPSANVTDHGRMIFRIRVDNNPTQARLDPVSVNGIKQGSCGFVSYQDGGQTVDLPYVAYHPNDFLSWSLDIDRGTSGDINHNDGSTSAGNPITPAHLTPTAASLLGGCTDAAFAVTLYCAARATDGYSRQSQYDSSAVIAFALQKT